MTNLFPGKIGSMFAIILLLISLLFGFGSKPSEPIDPPAPPEKDTEKAEAKWSGSYEGFSWERTQDGLHVTYDADSPDARFESYKRCDGYEWNIKWKSLRRACEGNFEYLNNMGVDWVTIAFTDRHHGALTYLGEYGCGNRGYYLFTTDDGGISWTLMRGSSVFGETCVLSTSNESEIDTFYLLENGQFVYSSRPGDTGSVMLFGMCWENTYILSSRCSADLPTPEQGLIWKYEYTEIGEITNKSVTLKYVFRGVPEQPDTASIAKTASTTVTLKREGDWK